MCPRRRRLKQQAPNSAGSHGERPQVLRKKPSGLKIWKPFQEIGLISVPVSRSTNDRACPCGSSNDLGLLLKPCGNGQKRQRKRDFTWVRVTCLMRDISTFSK